ncbi:MAG: hypothetical protein L0Z46_12570 [Nitrospiraceae bacterium]|nr:hypothetical protein [Nitrospiraceae bacterium]
MGDWREGQPTASTEQEDVWDWISKIGSGAAQGAATGAPLGGAWGAGIGAGLGAIQAASQKQRRDGPALPPQEPQPQVPASQPRPPDQSISPPAPVPASPAPSAAGQTPAGKDRGISPQLIQQLAQLLPLIGQLLAQQSRASSTGGTSAESEDGQDNGDYVPDDAFMAGENTPQSSNGESSEASEVAERGMAREEESLLDWIVEAGSGTHTAEWSQEGSIEVAPAMEWSVESSHFAWES